MRSELNKVIERLKSAFEKRVDESRFAIKMLELVEMLIDRQEENELLLVQRLEEILADL